MKIKYYLALGLALLSLESRAENEIRMLAPVGKAAAIWVDASPQISDWLNTADPLVCSTWNPGVDTVDQGVAFTQTSSDCLQNQQRSIQARQQDKISQAYRNKGAPVIEPRTLTVTSTRLATGTSPTSNWVSALALYSPWVNTAEPAVCTTWTPDPITIAKDIQFQQTANDCQQTQQRTVQEQEQNIITLAYRNKGAPYIASQKVTVTQTRTAVGTNPVDQGDYMVSVGVCCSGQHGYIPANTGAIVSSSNTAYEISYLVVKDDGTVYFAFTEVTAATAPAFVARIKTVTLDFLDANKNLVGTTTANPARVQFSKYMGWQIAGTALTQALSARYYRLHIELN